MPLSFKKAPLDLEMKSTKYPNSARNTGYLFNARFKGLYTLDP
jgi:hypothetical protein